MGVPNKGKKFETNWRNSATNQELFILRLNDTSLSFVKEKNARFTCENPCDFIMFYERVLFPLELKSTEYNSISIQTRPEEQGMIKLHQVNSLTNFNTFDGILCGFILNYRSKDSLDETTYWVYIQDFVDFMAESGKKSINKLDCVHMPHTIVIDQKLKRTQYDYDVKGLLEKVISKFNKEDSDFNY